MKNCNYAWRESYEERRLSPVETEEERRALENAWEGVRALISESTMKLV